MKEDKEAESEEDKQSEKREPVCKRHHDMYFDRNHWTVVDVSDVDNLFVADMITKTEREEGFRTGDERVRLDIDGFNEPSSEVGERRDNMNLSIWLDDERAEQLYEDLKTVLGKEKEEDKE